jgi:hypothetical protein
VWNRSTQFDKNITPTVEYTWIDFILFYLMLVVEDKHVKKKRIRLQVLKVMREQKKRSIWYARGKFVKCGEQK